MKLQTIIGLEFHIQLKTKSKMFCSCANEPEEKKPNVNICPICMAHPGTLPMVNREAVEMGIKAALAINCEVKEFTKFDRKNYFYPDLPKGYQISQFDKPLAEDGWLAINNTSADGLAGRLDDEKQLNRIGIIRLHMEEDSAKSTHSKKDSIIDFNRGGLPLIEIVTAPHFNSGAEAKTFAQELRLIMRYLDISNAEMEKGQMRVDANISLRPEGDHNFYPKTEIKNINSFRALERALEFEIKRQTILWEKGDAPKEQSTRGWDEKKQETVAQRIKEEAHDYRYFPEPDLPPLTFTAEKIQGIKSLLPELPQAKRRRFMEMYEFPGEAAKILCETKELANYAEKIISEMKDWLKALENVEGSEEEIWENNKKKLLKLVSGWLVNKFLPSLQSNDIELKNNKVTPENFAEFLTLIHQNKINSSTAQIILEKMVKTGADPSHIIEEEDLTQMTDSKDLTAVIEKIIASNPEQAEEFKNGKEPIIQYFVGLAMKETRGKAEPKTLEQIFRDKLK
ncbi:Asp-tRNA(Asn)/Glu-tRNA(Gln) amidotransferase subunit GatB [Patescibacteria group bacterium]|nr:Asp-tRNA(Asn)/Glu-tRNA(Gln) amidotransferase subunit GatB [Patescibacteria group bacterium]